MDRRNFLRTGSLAMLGSLAVPSLAMPASVRGALGGADNQSAVASAMAHFGVTEADLKKVMAAALEKGGDYAEIWRANYRKLEKTILKGFSPEEAEQFAGYLLRAYKNFQSEGGGGHA